MCDCGAYDCKRCGPAQGYYGLPCEVCGMKDYDCECSQIELNEAESRALVEMCRKIFEIHPPRIGTADNGATVLHGLPARPRPTSSQ